MNPMRKVLMSRAGWKAVSLFPWKMLPTKFRCRLDLQGFVVPGAEGYEGVGKSVEPLSGFHRF